jgi:LmbE family N-acetylglucosaminyl deacetylase
MAREMYQAHVSQKKLFRSQFRTLLHSLMVRNMAKLSEKQLGSPTVVFSPHPDDETLGCGGTIARKKKIGSLVKVVFVTDGRRSHLRFMSGDEMKAIREKEAVEAGNVLGLDEEDLVFLRFRNGELSANWASCISAVREFLKNTKPKEVFIPYRGEPAYWGCGDHVAVNAIVLSALLDLKEEVVVNEYPVGFWDNWPWTSPPVHTLVQEFGAVKNGVFSSYILLRDFRCFVELGGALSIKLAALDEYKSQLTRLKADPAWVTLADVSNGEFLERFVQEREIFNRYILRME